MVALVAVLQDQVWHGHSRSTQLRLGTLCRPVLDLPQDHVGAGHHLHWQSGAHTLHRLLDPGTLGDAGSCLLPVLCLKSDGRQFTAFWTHCLQTLNKPNATVEQRKISELEATQPPHLENNYFIVTLNTAGVLRTRAPSATLSQLGCHFSRGRRLAVLPRQQQGRGVLQGFAGRGVAPHPALACQKPPGCPSRLQAKSRDVYNYISLCI